MVNQARQYCFRFKKQRDVSVGSRRLAHLCRFNLSLKRILSGYDGATLGNFTVQMPHDHEGVLSMERFDGLLTNVDRSEKGLALTFEDDPAFAYAKQVWDWVNGADNHTFLMVAGKGDCGDNHERVPYLVSSLAYDEDRNIALLSGKTGEWQDLVHTWQLRIGSLPQGSDLGLNRRDYHKDFSFDLNRNCDFRQKVKYEEVSGTITLSDCTTSGRVDFEIYAESKAWIPTSLEFNAVPSGLKAQATIKIEASHDFQSKKNFIKNLSLLKIPLDPISLGKLATLGPVLDIQTGVEVLAFQGTISISTTATATLPDGATSHADLLESENNKATGWDPSLDTTTSMIQTKTGQFIKQFLEPALQFEAQAMGETPFSIASIEGHPQMLNH